MTSFWPEFLQTVQRYPDAAAIEEGGRTVTYTELAAEAARIGMHLNKQGVTAETPVALEMEKSAAYVAAMLGCWYAGAAFVPLPPGLPQARRDYILRHADIRHTLTIHDLQNLPESSAPLQPADVQAGTLAYTIYTSGSTGAPKGVMIEHRGITSFLKAQIGAFETTVESRSLFYLSILFDAAISDIGVALLSGACLVIPPENMTRDGAALVKFIRERRITHMDVPPSLLKAIDRDDMPESLKTIIIGGEVCPPDIVRQWIEKFRVVNVYGPTEATVCTSLCVCGKAWDKPLVGDPLPGISYVILEDELYIGGIGLARGYLKQPELTAEKFIQYHGERLYKTGDRVRRHTDGTLEFLGRIDRQFKLRGQLVEPGEIEARLMAYPPVKRAAVVKRDERLVAFIEAQEGALRAGIEAHLRKSLPAWMIPQHFILLQEWPLTSTGKTDYATLQTLPVQACVQMGVAPATDREKALWRLWCRLLKHENFGVMDDFFAVGGDSLAVIRMTLEAERNGIDLPAETLAHGRTIRALANSIPDSTMAQSCEWLKKDVAFDEEWPEIFRKAQQRPPIPKKEPTCIFLTGATGFLGGYLLRELLQRTKADIYCLVRADNIAAAEQRLGKLMSERLRVLCGDLTQPRFGLDEHVWKTLSAEVDAVYHCAANVNMVLSYADLRAANVSATKEVLRFACEGQRKHLHYASTLSVFVATDRSKGRLMETDRLHSTRSVYGGYAQTKWAAEWMLLQVPKEACEVTHYRFGLITGDTKTGVCAARDFLAMFAKGITKLQAVPEGFDEKFFVDVTPVDHAAAAMTQLSLAGKHDIYHIANPQSLSLGHLLQAIGKRATGVRPVPVSEWTKIVKNKALTVEETAAWLALCRVVPEEFERRRAMDLFQATDVTFDMTHRNADLKGPQCPEASENLLATYMDYIFKT